MASDKPKFPPMEPPAEIPKEIIKVPTVTAPRASSTPPQPSLPSSFLNTEHPPPKPPRPMSYQQQAQATLHEAFPSIDPAVVRAVLVASSGQLEPAFTALLSMSDPSAADEMRPVQPPRHPPRHPPSTQSPQVNPPLSLFSQGQTEPLQQDLNYQPAQTYTKRPQGPSSSVPDSHPTSTPQNQLKADEMYARQLAEHFETNNARSVGARGSTNVNARNAESRRNPQQSLRPTSRDDEYGSDKEHSFLDDDLPVIKENIRKGFVETQNKFNSWITDIKKRLDGDSPENSPPSLYARPTTRPLDQPSTGNSRDVGYDADPRVISDDFTHLHLRDNSIMDAPQPRRPKPNPDLFQRSTVNKTGRKVSFEDRPTNISDDDLYRPALSARSPAAVTPARMPSPVTASKWEPLKSVEPAPMDRDPFSLGDSDDEREVSPKELEAAASTPVAQEVGVLVSNHDE